MSAKQASMNHIFISTLLLCLDREQKEDTEETKFELDLPMTDPDFPFELESIHLLVMWPTHYPLRSCPRVILKDSNIPHNIGKKIQIFLDRELPRWQGEPCMRALLHFIDQNLEKWAVAPDPSSTYNMVFIQDMIILVSSNLINLTVSWIMSRCDLLQWHH